MDLDWDELAASSLARQFPRAQAGGTDLVDRTGPIQSQTARSAFLALAARGGVGHADLTRAYEDHDLVRGSVIRGTVHTATAAQHRTLDAVTRVGMRRYWQRQLDLRTTDPETLWESLEQFASGRWRSPDQLRDHLLGALERHGETTEAARSRVGRYVATGHSGLVRRPLRGGWETQATPVYRCAADVTGLPAPPTSEALDDLVRLHLRCHGPSSRQDLAWWSGLPLSAVDRVLHRLAPELSTRLGPLDREYHDLPGAPSPVADVGVRLLPEFDALLCAYDSKARDRFVSAEHHARLWQSANGQILPPVLVDGRIGGFWRSTGSARRRPLEVHWFRGSRRPRKAELEQPVTALEVALGIQVTELTVSIT